MRWAVRLAAGCLALALAAFGLTAVRVWQVAREDSRATADAIVVLGASQFNGRPSAIFRARLDHARSLYDGGVAPRVVTVGGGQPGDVTTEAASGARYLRDNGVPADAVYDVPTGSDTVTSLRAAAEMLRGRQWARVVLVTDPWHSMRSRTVAADLGLRATTSPARTGPANEGRWSEFRYVVRESAAYLYYRVFHRGFGGGPAAA